MIARAVFVAVLVAPLALHAPALAEIRPDEKRSDAVMMGPALQAMQADEAANPGMLAVLDGQALWNAKAGGAGRSCASCHGDAATSMRGTAARFPRWSEERNAAIDLAQQIDLCRSRRQDAAPLAPESPNRLALTAYVARQSLGMPISTGDDPRMTPVRQRGRELFSARVGQLNLSCASCHDDNWGKRLAGAPVPQAHPVGYPIYRLEWQSVGSLQRRFRNCMTGVRAEAYPFNAPEWIELEAFLMDRAAGLAIETPAVRP